MSVSGRRCRRWPSTLARRPASRRRRSSPRFRSIAASGWPPASRPTAIAGRAAPDGRPANERAGQAVVDEAHRPGSARTAIAPHVPLGAPLRAARAVRHARRPPAGRRPLRRRGGRSRPAGRPAARRARDRRGTRRWWCVARRITARRSASTARSATACSSTTRRCACRWSSPGPGIRRAGRRGRRSAWSTWCRRRWPGWACRPADGDGVDLSPAARRAAHRPTRALYAESFAPLLDFGWSPLRALRDEGRKYIAAPRPELYDLAPIPARRAISAAERARRVAAARARAVERHFAGDAGRRRPVDADAARRAAVARLRRHRGRPAGAATSPTRRIGASWPPASPR